MRIIAKVALLAIAVLVLAACQPVAAPTAPPGRYGRTACSRPNHSSRKRGSRLQPGRHPLGVEFAGRQLAAVGRHRHPSV